MWIACGRSLVTDIKTSTEKSLAVSQGEIICNNCVPFVLEPLVLAYSRYVSCFHFPTLSWQFVDNLYAVCALAPGDTFYEYLQQIPLYSVSLRETPVVVFFDPSKAIRYLVIVLLSLKFVICIFSSVGMVSTITFTALTWLAFRWTMTFAKAIEA